MIFLTPLITIPAVDPLYANVFRRTVNVLALVWLLLPKQNKNDKIELGKHTVNSHPYKQCPAVRTWKGPIKIPPQIKVEPNVKPAWKKHFRGDIENTI
jgi:hypothetical protein